MQKKVIIVVVCFFLMHSGVANGSESGHDFFDALKTESSLYPNASSIFFAGAKYVCGPFYNAFCKLLPKKDTLQTALIKTDWTDKYYSPNGAPEPFVVFAEINIDPEKREAVSENPPIAIHLYGPPGCGKSSLILAWAKAHNIPITLVVGPEFRNKYYGEGARLLVEEFDEAIAAAKITGLSIIFIDEIDAIGKRRDDPNSNHNNVEQVTTLLGQLDRIKVLPHNERVLFITATNIPLNQIDTALAERLNPKIYIAPPEASTRGAILQHHLNISTKNNNMSKNYSLETINKIVQEAPTDASGRHLQNIAAQALWIAIYKKEKSISDAHLLKANEWINGHNKKPNTNKSMPPTMYQPVSRGHS